MAPFGMCAELLNTKVVQPLLGPGMEIAVKYAQNLNDEDLKDKVSKNKTLAHFNIIIDYLDCN